MFCFRSSPRFWIRVNRDDDITQNRKTHEIVLQYSAAVKVMFSFAFVPVVDGGGGVRRHHDGVTSTTPLRLSGREVAESSRRTTVLPPVSSAITVRRKSASQPLVNGGGGGMGEQSVATTSHPVGMTSRRAHSSIASSLAASHATKVAQRVSPSDRPVAHSVQPPAVIPPSSSEGRKDGAPTPTVNGTNTVRHRYASATLDVQKKGASRQVGVSAVRPADIGRPPTPPQPQDQQAAIVVMKVTSAATSVGLFHTQLGPPPRGATAASVLDVPHESWPAISQRVTGRAVAHATPSSSSSTSSPPPTAVSSCHGAAKAATAPEGAEKMFPLLQPLRLVFAPRTLSVDGAVGNGRADVRFNAFLRAADAMRSKVHSSGRPSHNNNGGAATLRALAPSQVSDQDVAQGVGRVVFSSFDLLPVGHLWTQPIPTTLSTQPSTSGADPLSSLPSSADALHLRSNSGGNVIVRKLDGLDVISSPALDLVAVAVGHSKRIAAEASKGKRSGAHAGGGGGGGRAEGNVTALLEELPPPPPRPPAAARPCPSGRGWFATMILFAPLDRPPIDMTKGGGDNRDYVTPSPIIAWSSSSFSSKEAANGSLLSTSEYHTTTPTPSRSSLRPNHHSALHPLAEGKEEKEHSGPSCSAVTSAPMTTGDVQTPPPGSLFGVPRRLKRAHRYAKLLFYLPPGAVRFSAILAAFTAAGFEETGDLHAPWSIRWAKRVEPHEYGWVWPWQKLNHFPATWGIGRKDNLHRRLTALKRRAPKEYDFVPEGYVLPRDAELLRRAFAAADSSDKSTTTIKTTTPGVVGHNQLQQVSESLEKLFIVKQVASACGRGMHLISRLPSDRKLARRALVQRYEPHPYLIGGRKFDLRIYVAVTCFDPMRVYVFKEGLVRFASSVYPTAAVGGAPAGGGADGSSRKEDDGGAAVSSHLPSSSASAMRRVRTAHLTNYSINGKPSQQQQQQGNPPGAPRRVSMMQPVAFDEEEATDRHAMVSSLEPQGGSDDPNNERSAVGSAAEEVTVCKWTFAALRAYLEYVHDPPPSSSSSSVWTQLWERIDDVIVRTLLSVEGDVVNAMRRMLMGAGIPPAAASSAATSQNSTVGQSLGTHKSRHLPSESRHLPSESRRKASSVLAPSSSAFARRRSKRAAIGDRTRSPAASTPSSSSTDVDDDDTDADADDGAADADEGSSEDDETAAAMSPLPNIAPRTSPANNPSLFELYGFDVLLRHDLTPVLMEVNIMPSLSSCDSELDQHVKANMIAELLTLVGVQPPPLATTGRREGGSRGGAPAAGDDEAKPTHRTAVDADDVRRPTRKARGSSAARSTVVPGVGAPSSQSSQIGGDGSTHHGLPGPHDDDTAAAGNAAPEGLHPISAPQDRRTLSVAENVLTECLTASGIIAANPTCKGGTGDNKQQQAIPATSPPHLMESHVLAVNAFAAEYARRGHFRCVFPTATAYDRYQACFAESRPLSRTLQAWVRCGGTAL